MWIVFQILLAWFYSHILENILHRAIHDRKRFKFAFRNHFKNHHGVARKNQMRDNSYKYFLRGSSKFELGALSALYILHIPLLFLFPAAYITLLVCGINYYYVHSKCHTDVEWGKKYYYHHYEHHMGKNQHDNWGVRAEWPDKLINLFIS